MPTYLCPGVYVEEISRASRPIEAVSTSVAGFVGETPNGKAHLNEAYACNNWLTFVKEFVGPGDTSTPLSQAIYGFFENGGTRCFVVNVGPGNPIVGDGKGRKGLEVLETVDEVAIVAAPGRSDPQSTDALLKHCEKMLDRFAIIDAPADFDSIAELTEVATVPGPGQPPKDEESGKRARKSQYGAQYAPYLAVYDALNPREMIWTPPSGYLAGIYAQTDNTRGVHKAPANVVMRGVGNLKYRFTRDEQGELNKNGVNCIRFFNKQGIVVWGSRTLDVDSEYRYIPVRRFTIQVEESIGTSTQWVVFEPNGPELWRSIRRDIGAFLTLMWRDGALAGRTPEEAFYVKCDEEINTPEVINAGRVITEVGLATLKPAEFVIFRIGQHERGTEKSEGGAANA